MVPEVISRQKGREEHREDSGQKYPIECSRAANRGEGGPQFPYLFEMENIRPYQGSQRSGRAIPASA